jgi:predicted kinase
MLFFISILMQLILFIGVQASGKSTFYQHYFARSHLRINLDMLKTRHREKIIFEACIQSKTQCVIDNTNMRKEDRARYMQHALDADFEVIAYYFATDLTSTLQRNAQREGKAKIAEKGVIATYHRLEMPELSEGFSEIYHVQITQNHEFSMQLFAQQQEESHEI